MKTCSTCKTPQPLENYTRQRANRDGLDYNCRSCKSEMNRLKRESIMADPAKKAKYYEQRKWAIFKQWYGITQEDYKRMWKEQGSRCKICKRPLKNHKVEIDHCHKTGRVRGLLCCDCNRGLGGFRDQPHLLKRAIEYLRSG